MTDHELAHLAADGAGRLLMALRESSLLSDRALGAAGDDISNNFLQRVLRTHRADDEVLSEESPCSDRRIGMQRVWIIDPLDGTREYSERDQGRTDWAVHVALAIDGVPAASAVAIPALGQTISTLDAPGFDVLRPARARIVVSRTRPPKVAARVAAVLHADVLPMGSAGAKAMAVVRGEADAYLHAGGQHEWDSCAPVGVALARGLHASRLDGSACVYNQASSWMPDLLICTKDLAERILAQIEEEMMATR
jgi:3'(2'), 5'-bisphosphate nucleotidase